jgi:hypothetical protein
MDGGSAELAELTTAKTKKNTDIQNINKTLFFISCKPLFSPCTHFTIPALYKRGAKTLHKVQMQQETDLFSSCAKKLRFMMWQSIRYIAL